VGELTPDKAEEIAWTMYTTDEPAVIELLLLASNGATTEDRFKALRALEWFDPATTEAPARPWMKQPEPGPVEEAIEALRWTLYGWEQSSRARAAARAGALISELAANA